MRDAILEVLYGAKTLSEACRGNNLAPTTLSTYVRLVKALINTNQVVSVLFHMHSVACLRFTSLVVRGRELATDLKVPAESLEKVEKKCVSHNFLSSLS